MTDHRILRTLPSLGADASRLCDESIPLISRRNPSLAFGGRATWVAASVALLLTAHACLLAWAAARDSPTLNEPGHLVAGISDWRFGRFDIYRVNPPLTRMVAALPVLAAGCKTDYSQFFALVGARPEFLIGGDFVTANGERSLYLFRLARWACIPMSLIGGLVCFLWGRDLYGSTAGLLSLSLWCFDPNVLAHGHLITPDVTAAAFGLTACYLFWHWLKRPTWWWTLASGLGLGLAELSKMSWVFLFWIWPLMWSFDRVVGRAARRFGGCPEPPAPSLRSEAARLTAILALGLYVLNVGYAFNGTWTRLGDYVFVSQCLAGQEKAGQGGNIFAGRWIGELPLPVPKPFLLGIDLQKRDFEHLQQPSYLRGEWKDGGWWYYYCYGLLVKVPHGTQLLFMLAIVIPSLRRERRFADRDEIVLLLPALALLLMVSAEKGFNHHMRYVLPAAGFCFVFIGRLVGRPWSKSLPVNVAVAAVLLLAATASCLRAYPHTLSYFNEGSGGLAGGHRHLLHSNIDWGQDLIVLKEFIEDNPQYRGLHFVTSNYWDPAVLGIDCRKLPVGCDPNHSLDWRRTLSSRFIAISVNVLMGERCRIYLGPLSYLEVNEGTFAQLRSLRPVAKIGASIWIFDVTDGVH